MGPVKDGNFHFAFNELSEDAVLSVVFAVVLDCPNSTICGGKGGVKGSVCDTDVIVGGPVLLPGVGVSINDEIGIACVCSSSTGFGFSTVYTIIVGASVRVTL